MELDRPETWDSAYEDFQLTVKRDPTEPQGYCVVASGRENYLLLPRGCLKDITLSNRDVGKQIIMNLNPIPSRVTFFDSREGLTPDSVLAAIALTYIKEQARRYRR